MRVQSKIVLVMFLVLLGTLSAVIWKTRALVMKDKLGFMADASMRQMAPLKRLVEERIDSQKAKLVSIALTKSQGGKVSESIQAADFDVVSLVQNMGVASGGQWTPLWLERGSASRAEVWPRGFDQTLIKSLPYGRVRDGEALWVRLSDPQGGPIFALLLSAELKAPVAAEVSAALPDDPAHQSNAPRRVILVGLFSHAPLADITEDFIGSMNSIYIVDDKGYVATHVNKAFTGALFSEDPLVDEIIQTRKTAASGTFEDLQSQPVLGHFEKIDRTNLYAVITSPLESASDFTAVFLQTALAVSLAVGGLGLAAAWLFARRLAQPLGEAVAMVEAINKGQAPKLRAVYSSDEIGQLMRLLADSSPAALASKFDLVKAQIETPPGVESLTGMTTLSRVTPPSVDQLARERKAAYETFINGCTNAIKEPLLAILGHAQLAKSKTADMQIRSHAESIEREARRAKDVMDRLHDWSMETSSIVKDGEYLDLKEVAENLLNEMSQELEADGVTIERDLHRVPLLAGSVDQIRTVLKNMLENAREAMLARNPKIVKVQVDFLRDSVFCVVSDNGVGMARDVRDRAFEPFFKGFVSPKRMGIGLSVVEGVTKSMGGVCQIESIPGEGATVTLKFPVESAQRESFLQDQGRELAKPPVAKANEVEAPPPPAPLAAGQASADSPSEKAEAAGPESGTYVHADLPDFSDELDVDDDDANDAFASVQLTTKPPTAKRSEPEAPEVSRIHDFGETEQIEAVALAGSNEFRVKIRKPRLRS